MAAYYQEVHQLEDKFDGLELNHIPRRLNEAPNTMAKMASGREPVPTGVFASDQHKPSKVRYEGSEQASEGLPALGSGVSPPSAPSDLEAMEIHEDPVMELDVDLAAEPDPPTD